MSKLTKALTAAAGNAGESLYAEDVFSTYLYDGNGSNRSIINGIDLAGEGGLVWAKMRSGTPSGGNNVLYDTERGAGKYLISDLTSAQSATDSVALTSFNSNGFSLGVDNASGLINYATRVYASWSWRKAEKFFDVVTYTGNGTTQSISHNLGSTPGVIIVKNTQSSTYWAVYHGSVPAYVGFLNATNAFDTSNTQNFGNNTNPVAPTDSVFTVGQQSTVNSSGETYVAYLFASDAGGFGDDGSENIIKCGSYTGGGTSDVAVNLGFEPQWILIKNASAASTGWQIVDNMRGLVVGDGDAILYPSSSGAEGLSNNPMLDPTATGFNVSGNFNWHNASGNTYIYIAIRRPMKTPEAGTEVFGMATATNTDPLFVTGLVTDLGFYKYIVNTGGVNFGTRLLQGTQLDTATTAAEVTQTAQKFDYQNGFRDEPSPFASTQYIGYGLKRATGFMDVVAYTGNGASSHALTHNLGVSPELIITKRRDASGDWRTATNFSASAYSLYKVNEVDPATNINYAAYGMYAAKPTSTTFTVGSGANVNASGGTFVSYLFGTVAGVSKVGSVVHSGTTNVDCGFSAGARFVLAKRADQNSGWYVWDTTQGIVAGNSPFWQLNGGTAQVTNTDYIDPLSSGFTLTSSFTAGTYIFLAIA